MITAATEEPGLAGKLFLGSQSLEVANDVVIGQWINTACTILIVYEWLITLGMEVQFVWCHDTCQNPKILTKVLYVASRYGVAVDLVFNYLRDHSVNVGICKTVLALSGVTVMIGTSASEYILALRVCAVWKMKKIVIFSLTAIFIGKNAYSWTEYYRTLQLARFSTLLPFGGCLSRSQGSKLWIFYVLLAFYDLVMLSLMAYPTIKEYKFVRERTDLVRHVFNEGVIFYVFLLLVDIACVALQLTVLDKIYLLPTPTRLSRSILATRTMLHLRELSSRDIRVTTATTTGTTMAMSDIRFRSGADVESGIEEA